MMSTVWSIAKKEFLAYFRSPIGYVVLVTFLVLSAFLFFKSFFLIGQADLRSFFLLLPWIFLFYVPAVAMGKWAEERRQGTLELLLTLPVSDRDVVLGKFFAGLGLIGAALACTVPMACTVAALGDLDWGPVIGGYLGLLFVGGGYLAIGLVVSSLTQNQIVAFIAAVVCCFLMLIIGEPIFTAALPPGLVGPVQYLGLSYHFASIGRGVIDVRDIAYYLSFIGFCLWINYRVILRRR